MTKLKAGEVVVLKRLEGNDIIGRLVLEYDPKDDTVLVGKPVEAVMVQSPGGGLGLAFSPFSLAARDNQNFYIPRNLLMVDPFLARDEVKKTYNEQTSSLTLL